MSGRALRARDRGEVVATPRVNRAELINLIISSVWGVRTSFQKKKKWKAEWKSRGNAKRIAELTAGEGDAQTREKNNYRPLWKWLSMPIFAKSQERKFPFLYTYIAFFRLTRIFASSLLVVFHSLISIKINFPITFFAPAKAPRQDN